jgi:hypothetical protein
MKHPVLRRYFGETDGKQKLQEPPVSMQMIQLAVRTFDVPFSNTTISSPNQTPRPAYGVQNLLSCPGLE